MITGLSGSGKTFAAFDTLYAEGQRRYVESLSAYARQFLDQMERPEVDSIEGLSPSIAIEQKTTTRSPRSTVGTITEIYDYLRVVYSSIGTPHCPKCGKPISRQSTDQIVRSILQGELAKSGDRVMILAPIVRGRKGEYRQELEKAGARRFCGARIDGDLCPLDDPPRLGQKKESHHRSPDRPSAGEARDRCTPRAVHRRRAETGERPGYSGGRGRHGAGVLGKKWPAASAAFPFRNWSRCSFSSTRPTAARARRATVSGSKYDFDPAKVIVDWTRPLFEGALGPGSGSVFLKRNIELGAMAHGFDLSTPFEKFPREVQNLILYGNPPSNAKSNGHGSARAGGTKGAGKTLPGLHFQGVVGFLESNFEESGSTPTVNGSPSACRSCRAACVRRAALASGKSGGESGRPVHC